MWLAWAKPTTSTWANPLVMPLLEETTYKKREKREVREERGILPVTNSQAVNFNNQ